MPQKLRKHFKCTKKDWICISGLISIIQGLLTSFIAVEKGKNARIKPFSGFVKKKSHFDVIKIRH